MYRHRLFILVVAVMMTAGAPLAVLAQGKKGGGANALPRLSPSEMIPYIDTHAHLDFQRLKNVDATLRQLVATMDALKIERTILMPVPEGGVTRMFTYDLAELRPALRQYPNRFLLMAGPGAVGEMYFQTPPDAVTESVRAEFKAKLEALARGPIAGFGEMGIVHLSLPMMGPKHAYEAVPADHPLLLMMSDIAAEHGLAIDVHFDLVPKDMDLPSYLANPAAVNPNPPRLLQNREGFERFLAHNRGAKIVWAHVGGEPISTRTPDVVRQMLSDNPNLYMSFRLIKTTSNEADALNPQGKLKSVWATLIADFPDRFVLGSDTFYQDGSDSRGGTIQGFENFHRMLAQLPSDLARKVARDNVAAIYRLGPAPVAAPESAAPQPGASQPVAPAPTKGFAKKGKGKGANP